MKKIKILFLLVFPFISQAQPAPVNENYIEINAEAEEEVRPDKVLFGIQIQEFHQDKKKVSLEELEGRFKKIIQQLSIPSQDVEIQNVSGYKHWRRRQPEEFLASESFILTIRHVEILDTLINSLSNAGISQVNIMDRKYTGEDELIEKLRLKALKKARQEADLLLESVGQKAGKVLFLRPLDQPEYGIQNNMYMMKSARAADMAQPLPEFEMRKIKYRAVVQVRFEIK